MTAIESIVLESPDPQAAEEFCTAFGADVPMRIRASQEPTSGFRGFSISLSVSQPSDVDALFADALDAGAESLKPPRKSLWGYGAVFRAPDGSVWKAVTSK